MRKGLVLGAMLLATGFGRILASEPYCEPWPATIGERSDAWAADCWCEGPPGSPVLALSKSGITAYLSWTPLDEATKYDVVRGYIGALRDSGGDYSTATLRCHVNDTGTTTPCPCSLSSGTGFWFLVRGASCGSGTYDSGGPRQVGSRDAGIAASGRDCDDCDD